MGLLDRKEEKNVITKDMLIGDLIRMKPESIDVLLRYGMGCIACPASLSETLEEACMVHGMEVERLLEDLNR